MLHALETQRATRNDDQCPPAALRPGGCGFSRFLWPVWGLWPTAWGRTAAVADQTAHVQTWRSL